MHATPETTLDTRFSDPDASPTSWADTRRALEAAELFWISTVRTSGQPHVTPLVAVWLDDALHFSTGAEEQKAVNLRANPHVVLSTGCNSWDGGLDIEVEGTAVRSSDDALLTRLTSAWASKWDGRWKFTVGDGVFDSDGSQALVFSVAPTRVLAFAKGTFAQTRHQF